MFDWLFMKQRNGGRKNSPGYTKPGTISVQNPPKKTQGEQWSTMKFYSESSVFNGVVRKDLFIKYKGEIFEYSPELDIKHRVQVHLCGANPAYYTLHCTPSSELKSTLEQLLNGGI